MSMLSLILTGSKSRIISFSKEVDEKERLSIPKEYRQGLTVQGRGVLAEIEARKMIEINRDTEGLA